MLKFLAVLLISQATFAGCNSIITPELTETLGKGVYANIFVTMREDIKKLLESITSTPFLDKTARLNALHDALQSHASRTQGYIPSMRTSQEQEFKSFWITNQIYIKNATSPLVSKLVGEFENIISNIDEEFIANIIDPGQSTLNGNLNAEEWGAFKIQAPDVWNKLEDIIKAGEGVVVDNVDTGALEAQQAFVNNFDNGHEAHTTGSRSIEVAPNATLAACRGCAGYFCARSDIIACYQFFACPTLADGTSPDCSKAPNAVFNSGEGARLTHIPMPGCENFVIKTRAYYECYLKTLTLTLYHPSGTCKMGKVGDPRTVVDSQLRVIGVKGLRVADASIMPQITNANLNAPTIMIGEMCADIIKQSWN